MEANFVKYYTELIRFRCERERERRSSQFSDHQALLDLLKSLQSYQADTARCGQHCQARKILDDMVIADWLLSIDQRFVLELGAWCHPYTNMPEERNKIIFPGCYST